MCCSCITWEEHESVNATCCRCFKIQPLSTAVFIICMLLQLIAVAIIVYPGLWYLLTLLLLVAMSLCIFIVAVWRVNLHLMYLTIVYYILVIILLISGIGWFIFMVSNIQSSIYYNYCTKQISSYGCFYIVQRELLLFIIPYAIAVVFHIYAIFVLRRFSKFLKEKAEARRTTSAIGHDQLNITPPLSAASPSPYHHSQNIHMQQPSANHVVPSSQFLNEHPEMLFPTGMGNGPDMSQVVAPSPFITPLVQEGEIPSSSANARYLGVSSSSHFINPEPPPDYEQTLPTSKFAPPYYFSRI